MLKTEADTEMTEYASDEKAYHTEEDDDDEEDRIAIYESTSQGEGKYSFARCGRVRLDLEFL